MCGVWGGVLVSHGGRCTSGLFLFVDESETWRTDGYFRYWLLIAHSNFGLLRLHLLLVRPVFAAV